MSCEDGDVRDAERRMWGMTNQPSTVVLCVVWIDCRSGAISPSMGVVINLSPRALGLSEGSSHMTGEAAVSLLRLFCAEVAL